MAFNEICQFSELSLNHFKTQVHLGCSDDERCIRQTVYFDVKVKFPKLPLGVLNDRLEDTVCYAALSDRISKVCEKTEFHLIEKLGGDVFSSLRELVPPQVKLRIQVTKEKPPIDNLLGGASFCLGDWDEN